ncbi:TetR/AcrR family transcriptional regulator [Amycolatopsis suaedae]|uniref:TetR/AcrR family transcriptional regulator n=2 Tax=Amycolatopsis suaedae TaxID=2510978 RepID=A0A4Q7J6M1_9PSEU|nr:TetR/AcrR family transcriptional regulator [Amycolatopsis suaedae]
MRPERPARGPAPTYSRERIAAAAVAIADKEGIEAVSMRRVATELGTGAMTLYRYVHNKDELHELMIDYVMGEDALPDKTGDWRTDLAACIRDHRTLVLTHTWLPRLMAKGMALGPNTLRGMEYAMSIVDGLGMTTDEMMETFGIVMSWADGFVRSELAQREMLEQSGMTHEELQTAMGAYVEHVLGTGKYPMFARIVSEARFRDADERFEHGITLLLDGIEANLPPRAG